MSEIFEGIVFPGLVDRLPLANLDASEMCLAQLDRTSTVAYWVNPRAGFSAQSSSMCRSLSIPFGRALLVRYDSRIWHRSSRLYIAGEETACFGEDDELFVPLDDRGYPITSATPKSRFEWDPNEEYETICNAIQLGLERLGVGRWDSLFNLMTS